MEETKTVTTATETAVETAPETATEKTFTQAEVDALIAKRLDRATKGMPSKEELSEFKAWKDSQQTEEEKWNNLTKERDTAHGKINELEAEIEQLKRQNYILGKGASGEAAEFAMFKAAKLVDENTTFEEAVDKILAEQPAAKPSFDWAAPLTSNKAAMSKSEIMAIKDREKRRAAIAENMGLFVKEK